MRCYPVLVWFLIPAAAWAQSDFFGYAVEGIKTLGKRVEAVAFSPDGKFLAAGTSDGQLAYRDLSSHSEFRPITTMGSRIVGLSFAKDSSLLVAGAENGGIWVISMTGNPSVARGIHLKGKVRGLAVWPANDWVAAEGGDNIVTVFDLKTGSEMYCLPHHTTKAFRALWFARGGASLAGVTADGAIWEWDVNTRQNIRSLQDEDKNVHAVAASSNTSLLAISTEVTALNKGALGDGGSGVGAGNPGSQGVDVSPGGKPEFGGGPKFGNGGLGGTNPRDLYRLNKVKIWDLTNGRIAKTLDGMDGQITELAMSVDDRFIGSVRQRIKDSYLDVFDVERGVRALSIPIAGSGTAVSFSGDGQWLASGNDRGQVAVYSVTGVMKGAALGI